MRTVNPGDRPKLDLQFLGLMAILVLAIGCLVYSTVRHFQAVNQMSEARKMKGDVQALLFWTMHQNGNDVMKAYNFGAIQRARSQG